MNNAVTESSNTHNEDKKDTVSDRIYFLDVASF